MDQRYWDGRYLERDQLWSGEPNGVLVAEVTDLPPGQALDLGCGEGADALWLAARGWLVTAVDLSRVALERAAAVSGDATVCWTHADVIRYAPPAGAFDLVSALYFPLPRDAPGPLRTLLAAVAPGGTLLVASHDLDHLSHHHATDIDPADYYRPDEIATFLDHTWTVEVDETRPRVSPAPTGTGHVDDVVLKARKETPRRSASRRDGSG